MISLALSCDTNRSCFYRMIDPQQAQVLQANPHGLLRHAKFCCEFLGDGLECVCMGIPGPGSAVFVPSGPIPVRAVRDIGENEGFRTTEMGSAMRRACAPEA